MTPTHKISQTIQELYIDKFVYSHVVYRWIPLIVLSVKIHVSSPRSIPLPRYDVITRPRILTKTFSDEYGHVVAQIISLIDLSVSDS
ncbi:MAG: hypothetical protein FD143_3543 [Ignavibacteria bacterium]|nr:MAG: hypothetical protein FD143_3543 [Ignavibacteria bacterium]